MQAEPRKILIVRTDRLGDVILSTPVISNLKHHFPMAKITFLCRPYTKEALIGNPYLDNVITYDKYNKQKDFLSTVKFAFKLRKEKFDWALILHPTNRAHLVTYLAGIPLRTGWDKKLGFLLTNKLPHKKHLGKKHELQYNFDILNELGIPVIDKQTYFPINPESEKKVTTMIKDWKISSDEKIVTIHPSASCPSKRWPQKKFTDLIDLLKNEIKCKIIIVTSKGQEIFGEELVKKDGVFDLRGKLSISQLGCLLKHSDLFISNDSGPVHIAASLNTPLISIFGRSDPGLSPKRWGPLGKNSFYFHKNIGCQPCLAHNCQKGFLCLNSIGTQEVFRKSLSLLVNE